MTEISKDPAREWQTVDTMPDEKSAALRWYRGSFIALVGWDTIQGAVEVEWSDGHLYPTHLLLPEERDRIDIKTIAGWRDAFENPTLPELERWHRK